MSYFSGDVSGEEVFYSSFKGMKKGSRRAKSGLITQNTKPKIPKPHLVDIVSESPYAQVQGLAKQRSISSIKLKTGCKNSSTPLNAHSSNSLLSKNKSQASFSQHPSELFSNLKQKFLSQNLNSGKNTSKIIEDRLLGTLKKIKEKQMGSNRFEAYQLAFEEIIEKDEVYGTLLKKIKDAYEQRIKYEKIDISKDVIEKLKDDINGLREKLLKNKQQKKFLMKKIEKLAKENVEISRSMEDRENRYMDLQDKLIKLSKIELEEVPTDENSWKYLVSENQHLIKVCEEMRKDIKHLSRKEKKLVKLVVALKNRGYPVEEVYQQDVHREQKKKVLTCDEPVVDDSENEDLISGRPIDVKKPEIVPKLNLTELEESQEEESESSYTSESEDQD